MFESTLVECLFRHFGASAGRTQNLAGRQPCVNQAPLPEFKHDYLRHASFAPRALRFAYVRFGLRSPRFGSPPRGIRSTDVLPFQRCLKLRLTLPLVIGLALVAATAPRALAFPRSGQQGGGPPVAATSQKAVNLSPIVVHGHKLPLPIVLQTIKTGLKLPWTGDMSDTRIRCRWRTQTASHFKVLWCESNRHHIMRVQKLHTALIAGHIIPMMNSVLVGFHHVNRGVLEALLNKLPSAGSSYTLRIPASEGKPEIDYIVKNGELVKILESPHKTKQSSH